MGLFPRVNKKWGGWGQTRAEAGRAPEPPGWWYNSSAGGGRRLGLFTCSRMFLLWPGGPKAASSILGRGGDSPSEDCGPGGTNANLRYTVEKIKTNMGS